MSARRAARAAASRPYLEETGQVPRCLLLGRCIEVWADPKLEPFSSGVEGMEMSELHSAWTRFSRTRSWWLVQAGVRDTGEGCRLVPTGPPWSAAYRPQWLTEVGCTSDDLASLRREADELVKLAEHAERSAARTRREDEHE